jgi:hypothetical protein
MSTQVLLAGTALVLAVAGLAAIAATRNVIKVVMGIQVITLAALLMLAAALAGADPRGLPRLSCCWLWPQQRQRLQVSRCSRSSGRSTGP